MAGDLFSLVVYVSDQYLRVPEDQVAGNEEKQKAWRFFNLAARLPMDLQMVLANRVFGLGHLPFIKRVHSENGFRKFAKGHYP